MTYIHRLPTLFGQIVREYTAPVVTESKSGLPGRTLLIGALLLIVFILVVFMLVKARRRRHKHYHAQGRSD